MQQLPSKQRHKTPKTTTNVFSGQLIRKSGNKIKHKQSTLPQAPRATHLAAVAVVRSLVVAAAVPLELLAERLCDEVHDEASVAQRTAQRVLDELVQLGARHLWQRDCAIITMLCLHALLIMFGCGQKLFPAYYKPT